MWRNYFTVGLRALTRSKTYAFINIFGLAIGVAACLAILLFIRYETSFDRWLPDADRTFQFHHVAVGGDADGTRGQIMPYVASTTLAEQLPEIEIATSLVAAVETYRINGQPVTLKNAHVVDGKFFDILKLPLLHGDPDTALSQVGSTVLTESTAMQLFGRTDVTGRTVTRITRDGDQDSRITGVLKDIPDNSHLVIEALYRTDPGGVGSSLPADAATGWWWGTGRIYAKVRPGADIASVNARIPAMLSRQVPHDPKEELPFRFELVNILDVHNLPIDWGVMKPGTPKSAIITFSVVALLLLIVACVNFTNLATARATKRAREVGLRKVLGASRKQLIVQFLGESLLLAGIATLLGLALLELTLPSLSSLIDSNLSMKYFGEGGIAVPALIFALTVGLAGGLYPAFYLSRFEPAEILKANKSSMEPGGSGKLRSSLVVGQFAVSIALIICTFIIYSQTLYARSADAGYRASGLLIVMNPSRIGDHPQVESFLRAARQIPGVTAAARTSMFPHITGSFVGQFRRQGATENTRLQLGLVDGETFQSLGVKLLAGRQISETQERDAGISGFFPDEMINPEIRERGINVVIDESAVRTLGFPDIQAAIGQTIDLESEDSTVSYTIVGVVNDARFNSMRFEAMPMLFMAPKAGHPALAIRFENANGADIRGALQQLWRSRVPDSVFEASFSDDRIAEMYAQDERRGALLALFAGLAILISCLGLFGLAAFTAERRTKEIGIRKVLGARSRDIVRLLVWQFTRPVIIANLIAWPVAWWAMREWLNGFSERIDLGPGPFVLAGAIALVIAIGTIAGHALKVARANPIHALRYE